MSAQQKQHHGPTPGQGEVHVTWGHRFRWTADHLSREEYNRLRMTYDELAEDCLDILESKFAPAHAKPSSPIDAYALLEKHHAEDPTLSRLWSEVTELPPWVDWEQIARGQDLYYRYGAATLTALAYQSLIGGTGSSGDVSEVLTRTGGFAVKAARRRLLETQQFSLQVTESLASVRPGGAGFATALRVRFLHARVRRRIMQLAATRPSYYSAEKHGVPVNDADSIGTIAAFSSNLIWGGLPRQGIYLRPQEILDYLALWRLVGLYMGVPTDHFATPEKAKAIMEINLLYSYNPTPTSKMLAWNMIRALELEPPFYASRALIEVNLRWLNGNELADAMDISRPTPYYWALRAGQTVYFAAMCYINRSIPLFDRWQIRTFRRELWSMVLDEKKNGLGRLSVFDFKYSWCHVPGVLHNS
ncbi:uncharacterized protein MYCFIDRAFT_191312 [Pseudocercospora fijiensis CIRAD86]|uniref:ER-bound oxygenase mpaB/mpaB'/Rubber oxygenase catalytic domain-containing protein n=1 Tax=Pseudocercospora fijiensis (strain CIRAD86) TaxID=383855 RepID=M3AKN5_PSEFD|nr:uncharacterized protein MYCFIDRAFT_191312 [Pseudocercospora fijiensis CIRAD86]EME78032.1 hypothetical protein MYCFIDRAFT_191312 [Pseudocercospora fijiensis CIRAD86]